MLRCFAFSVLLCLVSAPGISAPLPTSPRAENVIRHAGAHFAEALEPLGLDLGEPIYIRIFKEERELELWIEGRSAYTLFKTFPICAVSGTLGPKRKTGDEQAPEGFYDVVGDRLNPSSVFHLSMNIGYPNAFDRAHHFTGSNIMIHGNCVSVGCYAMTDAGIDEIYPLVHAALEQNGGRVPVHIFPFRMTDKNLSRHAGDQNIDFWLQLRPAYDAFEKLHQPPEVKVTGANYFITPPAP